jgi:iron complex outermembrane receptor protein
MTKTTGSRMSLFVGGAFLALATAAVAPSAMAQAPVAPSTGPGTIDVVVVTATKRETNLQKTPIAISVVGGQSLEARHVESLLNLADGAVPSLRIATFEARQSALTVGIRGIVPFDANQTARDQGVGVYIDGVYLGRQQGLNAALFDVERIEVLRGPQGTLFGRNTEGGALSIVTKTPTGQMGGRFSVGAGNYGAYGAEIHQNLPEFANLSLKVDALVQHQDAFVKNPMDGQAGWGQYHRRGGRITGLWKPTDAFSAEFSADIAKDENTPFYSQLLSYNPYGKRVRTLAEATAVAAAPAGTINPLPALLKVHTDRQRVSDVGAVQQPSVDDTGGVGATLKYKLNDNLELRSISSARAVGTNQWDNSGVGSRSVFAPNATFGRYSLSDLYQRQFSQEFQAVGSYADTVDYVLGIYYFKEHAKESAATPLTNLWNADGSAYTIRNSAGTSKAAAGTAGWEYSSRFLTRASQADTTSTALYGQATYTPTSMEALHVTAGGRLTKDKRDGVLYVVNGKATNFIFKYDDSRFDPLVTLAYDASSEISLYAKYSTGFRAGGANARSATFTAFGPEEVKAFEVGSKMYLLDRRARLNLAAYAMDRTDTQIDFDNVDTTIGSPTIGAHTEETRNAPGKSKIRGFEAELTFKPIDNMTLGLNYAYTDVKVPAAPFPFAGNPDVPVGTPFPVNVVYTPKNAASAFVDYEVPVGQLTVRGHLDANYADAQYSFQTEFADVSPTAKLVQNVSARGDKSFIVNGNIALADIGGTDGGPTATVSIWARNLLDDTEIYRISVANRGTIGDYGNLNPPRTFGIELSTKF